MLVLLGTVMGGVSGVMVEVELDLPKELARGARWVSFSSDVKLVFDASRLRERVCGRRLLFVTLGSFQDMVATTPGMVVCGGESAVKLEVRKVVGGGDPADRESGSSGREGGGGGHRKRDRQHSWVAESEWQIRSSAEGSQGYL
jgi:hypothetical protein